MSRFKICLSLLFFVLFFGSSFSTLAISQDNVTARVAVSSDSLVLSPPLNLLAVAISSTQIDLSWSPPEDITGVAGYYLYRDNVRFVSTNGLAYSDQNLLPATTYQYYLTSFDIFGQESSSTPTVTVTTSSVAPAPIINISETRHLVGSRFNLSNFKVVPIKKSGQRSLLVSFDTNWPTLASLRYGVTEDASLASIKGADYFFHHSYLLDSLPKSLRYYLTINLQTKDGFSPNLSQVYIDGRIFGDFFRPDDVSDLTLTPKDNSVLLTWRNPRPESFANIYIVRSDKFYPVTRFFGLPLYQGQGSRYWDRGLAFNKNYYYGIFVCDKNKICSLGSYAVAYLEKTKPVSLITATTSPASALRQCEQKTVFSGSKFSLATPASGVLTEARLCLARLTKADQVVGLHQLRQTETGVFESSLFSLTVPGIYRYDIECYDAFGAGSKKVACGEITVARVSAPVETKYFCFLIILSLLLILLFFSGYLILKTKRNKIKKC